MGGAVFPPWSLAWGQTMVGVMVVVVMVTFSKRTYARHHGSRTVVFSAPDSAAGHCLSTPPPETPGHTQASLAQSLVGSLNIHWKHYCWSWSSNTLTTWCEELTHLKRPWCWERLNAGGEGDDEDEIVGWHHRLNGQEFEQALGVGDGQGSLVWGSPWMGLQRARNDWATELSWTEHSLDFVSPLKWAMKMWWLHCNMVRKKSISNYLGQNLLFVCDVIYNSFWEIISILEQFLENFYWGHEHLLSCGPW